MRKQIVVALITSLFTLTCGCGGGSSPLALPVVSASSPQCFPEMFSPATRETSDSVWFTTDQACDIGTAQDQTYTLAQAHTIQLIVLQQGSNSGSVFEWDVVLTLTRPDGRSIQLQQQYDKHVDDVGNRQGVYALSQPLVLPAGSTVNLHRRDLPGGYCLQAGPWGTGRACATGQGVQLVGVLP
jgi:hypothetical protein